MALLKPPARPQAPPKNPVVRFETSLGAFEVELFADQVPRSAAFVAGLVQRGFYDGLHVHRVVDKALVQWGCPFSKDPADARCGSGSEGFVADEHTAKIPHERGTVGLANMGRKDTGGSQLFVNLRKNDLDWWQGGAVQCVVVGKVTSGLEVVDAIGKVKTAGKLFGDRPLTPVRVSRATSR